MESQSMIRMYTHYRVTMSSADSLRLQAGGQKVRDISADSTTEAPTSSSESKLEELESGGASADESQKVVQDDGEDSTAHAVSSDELEAESIREGKLPGQSQSASNLGGGWGNFKWVDIEAGDNLDEEKEDEYDEDAHSDGHEGQSQFASNLGTGWAAFTMGPDEDEVAAEVNPGEARAFEGPVNPVNPTPADPWLLGRDPWAGKILGVAKGLEEEEEEEDDAGPGPDDRFYSKFVGTGWGNFDFTDSGEASASNEEPKDEQSPRGGDAEDDAFAMLEGMGAEDVYKVTLLPEAQEQADTSTATEQEEMESLAGGDVVGMGTEEVYKVNLAPEATEAGSGVLATGKDETESIAGGHVEVDVFAMQGGMGAQDVYKVTLVPEAVEEPAPEVHTKEMQSLEKVDETKTTEIKLQPVKEPMPEANSQAMMGKKRSGKGMADKHRARRERKRAQKEADAAAALSKKLGPKSGKRSGQVSSMWMPTAVAAATLAVLWGVFGRK